VKSDAWKAVFVAGLCWDTLATIVDIAASGMGAVTMTVGLTWQAQAQRGECATCDWL
jgi:hypothetical protein